MAGVAVASAAAQFRLLLGLHFRILRRQATATPGRKFVTVLLVSLGTIASVLVGLVASASFAVARSRANFTPETLDEAVHLSLTLAWVILVLSPALGFRGNEFLDVTRIFHLPVSHRTAFTASTVGICLSGAVLFWLPPLLGVILGHMAPRRGWGVDWGALDLGVLAVRLALAGALIFQAVALGQALVLLFLNLLRSRRFRDLGMVLAPVIGGTIYLGTMWALTRGRPAGNQGTEIVRSFLASEPSRWFPFLPSRWLSEAVVAAGTGEWQRWLPFLLGFVPFTLLTLAFASWLQERAFLGNVPPLEAERAGAASRLPGLGLLRRLFPDPVLAIASKEIRLLRREPIVKTVLISQAFFLALPVLVLAVRPQATEDALSAAMRVSWLIPFLLVFVENTLTLNLLGLEGPGVSHLRTTPVSWRDVLRGKDLCYLLLFGGANALFSSAALAALSFLRPDRIPDPGASMVLAVVGGTAALAVVVAVGNVLSVALPTSLAVRGRMALRQQAAFSEGCYEKLARVAVFAGTLALVAPIPLALHVLPAFSEWFQEAWWTPLGALFCVLYARALLARSLPLAERMAGEGEEAILERLVRSGE